LSGPAAMGVYSGGVKSSIEDGEEPVYSATPGGEMRREKPNWPVSQWRTKKGNQVRQEGSLGGGGTKREHGGKNGTAYRDSRLVEPSVQRTKEEKPNMKRGKGEQGGKAQKNKDLFYFDNMGEGLPGDEEKRAP